jgi:hypothetical protein
VKNSFASLDLTFCSLYLLYLRAAQAMAVKLDPSIAGKVRKIVAMAGTHLQQGNTSMVGEYNVWADPEVSAAVASLLLASLLFITNSTLPFLILSLVLSSLYRWYATQSRSHFPGGSDCL